MDPITAFSLACNVMQVIEFSQKSIRIFQEIRVEGSAIENQALKENSEYMEQAAADLQQSLKDVARSKHVQTPNEIRLRDIANKCTVTANKLQHELKKLERNRSSGMLSSMRTTLRTISKKSTIEEIRVTMARYQDILQTHILVHMRCVQTYLCLSFSPYPFLLHFSDVEFECDCYTELADLTQFGTSKMHP